MKLSIEIKIVSDKYQIKCNNNLLLTADLELLKEYLKEQVQIWSGYSANILKQEKVIFAEQLMIERARSIISRVKKYFPDIDTERRDEGIIFHRHCLINILQSIGANVGVIARLLNRDRTTILHSERVYRQEIDINKKMQNAKSDILKIIGDFKNEIIGDIKS